MKYDVIRSGSSAVLDHSEQEGRNSTLISGNVTVAGRRTSVRLEPAMWTALAEICQREGRTIHDVVTAIDQRREQSTLTAAIRVYLMSYFRDAATEAGHQQAGHGPVH